MYIKSFNEGKKLYTDECHCLHYKLYSFCFGLDLGLGLDAMALALGMIWLTAAYTGCPALVTHDGAASGSGLRHSGTGRRHVSSGEVPLVAAD